MWREAFIHVEGIHWVYFVRYTVAMGDGGHMEE
jgi:hypothetical protein